MAFYNSIPSLNPIEIPETNLVLRAPASRDFQAWKHIREVSRDFLEPWEPKWPDNDLTRLGFRRRLKRYEQERERRTGETYFLISKSTKAPIGGITVSNIRYGVARNCNIGYWMGEEFAGKGFMKLTVKAVARHIFDDLKLCRIEAACLPGNKRSSKLLESIGFEREGHMRKYLEINGMRHDHILYSLLDTDDMR